MRLAATLTTMDDTGEREAERQPVALRGTLRDPAARPRDIVILDLSATGFLAELPYGVSLAPGAVVRVAASPFGRHEAVVVRQDARCHGFAFSRPLSLQDLAGVDAEQTSSVTPFPGAIAPGPDEAPKRPLSARASLAIMVAVSLGLWLALAAVVAVLSVLA